MAALAANADAAVSIAAAGAIPPLVQLLAATRPVAQQMAALALLRLAANAAIADTIAAAGAIPPLVRMSGPDSPDELIMIAEDTLRVFRDSSAEICAAIAAAEANANVLLMARLGLD
ncbi:hypothetical protein FOA52_013539 [Chlamydomonas sp. UWO 241]|nr:hypothetical protein FOA52_013539 [Chlamydomonas sp. UWO 241]